MAITLQKVINSKFDSITSAALVLGAASFLSRLLGLMRDRILAGEFSGHTYDLSIYYAAFRIPDLMYYLGVLGVVSAGLIPVFLDYLNKDKAQAWHMISSLVNIMIVFFVAICLIFIIFAPWIMKLIVPGFPQEELAMTVNLTRVMFLSPLFLGISAVFGSVIQSFKRFICHALAPILYNLGIIIGAVVLVPYLRSHSANDCQDYFCLYGLAVGVVLGALLHMIIQYVAARQCGFKWRFVMDIKFEGIRRVLRVMPPRALGLALNQVNIVLLTVIASTLTAGAIAIYNLAYNIWSFPLGIFSISFVTASFPQLSDEAQKKNVVKFLETFIATARQILFFIIPASALFIILRAQIVRVVLGTGKFSWADTIATFDTLAFLSLGLFAEALIWLFLRGFFAWEDAKTPFFLGIVATTVRILSAWYYATYWHMGVAGLALGYSVGSLVYLILLFIYLSNKLRHQSTKDIAFINNSENHFFVIGTRMVLAAFIAGLACYGMLRPMSLLVDMQSGLGILLQGTVAGLLGLVVYAFASWLMGIAEVGLFWRALKRRWPLRKLPLEIPETNGK